VKHGETHGETMFSLLDIQDPFSILAKKPAA
jgi:hypothetical protein